MRRAIQLAAEPNESPGPSTDELPTTWWRPSWHDLLAAVGWGWALLAGAAAVLAFVVAVVLLTVGLAFSWVLLKPALLLTGGAVILIGYVIRKGIQARREPFCIFCGYCLTGLPDHHRCPECGRAYTWQQIEEYRRDPQWFIERWKARQQLPPADTPVNTGPSRPRRRSRDGTD